jgi:hypothetical protein
MSTTDRDNHIDLLTDEDDVFLSPTTDGTMEKYSPSTQQLLHRLQSLKIVNEGDLESAMLRIDASISGIAQKRAISSAETEQLLRPYISSVDKIIILPDRIKDEDYYAGYALLALAKQLGFKVYFTVTPENFTRSEVFLEEIAKGVLIGVGDTINKVNIRVKGSDYENGRTFVRAHQIKGYFIHDKNLGIEALKKNHRFFGNNFGETEIINKKTVPIQYMEREYESIFREEDKECFPILLSLIKRSYGLLKPVVLSSIRDEYLLSFSEVTNLYCIKTIATGNARGRNLEKSRRFVPHKPRAAAMLLPGEYLYLMEILGPIFNNPQFCETSERWVAHIEQEGFKKTKSTLVELNNIRAEILEKYSSLTTKRLQEVREISDTYRTKRKRDISVGDIETMLSRRSDPAQKLCDEIVRFDPHFTGVLAPYGVWDEDRSFGINIYKTKVRLNSEINEKIPNISEYKKILQEKGRLSSEGYYIDRKGNMEITPKGEKQTVNDDSKNRYEPLDRPDDDTPKGRLSKGKLAKGEDITKYTSFSVGRAGQ